MRYTHTHTHTWPLPLLLLLLLLPPCTASSSLPSTTTTTINPPEAHSHPPTHPPTITTKQPTTHTTEFPDVVTLNLGGGYKVGRMASEYSTDLQKIGAPVRTKFEDFARETGRKLRLEVEPGTFLVANAGALLSTVQDKTATSAHTFLKLDAGMTEVLRPSLYGAQHPLVVLPKDKARAGKTAAYVVVGHCCESGDLLTPAPGEADTIAERLLNEAEIGDLCVVEGAGAYCAGMSTKNYNSFPEAAEVMHAAGGKLHLIRQRQSLDQVLQNEVDLPGSVIGEA